LSEAVAQLATQHPHIRGIIISTRGVGQGLDDPALEPLWASLAETGLVVFLHPHYGVGAQAWGTRDNGHVLPLALGFPFETTIVCTQRSSYDFVILHVITGNYAAHPSGCS
jgi:predicted TIM-barrel fold metal-dependent hydrolase